MSSVGASYGHVHVQKRRQKEKLKKKMEDERTAESTNIVDAQRPPADDNNKSGKNKKIHPVEPPCTSSTANSS
ncbi:hypothetical protein F511_07304 [Dorcoceras hygrometricum]|uniref:Uncharacterized protein n=1 Tax=Dorcoceras hygrometricum TaxID=472368 RepID=A0A2Z7CSH9_9LAMI|nr:hypothetical protein F511_07304 [Dorcoceras hygrometricum]